MLLGWVLFFSLSFLLSVLWERLGEGQGWGRSGSWFVYVTGLGSFRFFCSFYMLSVTSVLYTCTPTQVGLAVDDVGKLKMKADVARMKLSVRLCVIVI